MSPERILNPGQVDFAVGGAMTLRQRSQADSAQEVLTSSVATQGLADPTGLPLPPARATSLPPPMEMLPSCRSSVAREDLGARAAGKLGAVQF